MAAKHERFLDGDKRPRARDIHTALGTREARLWTQVRAFLKKNYDFTPELIYYGNKYGWCYKYRRKGKTLCVLFPETKAFTVLVTMGKKEVAQFEDNAGRFNEITRALFETAYQYHDGKWLYKRVLNRSDLQDVISLIKMKSSRGSRGQI